MAIEAESESEIKRAAHNTQDASNYLNVIS
jgi:hypothetical protein